MERPKKHWFSLVLVCLAAGCAKHADPRPHPARAPIAIDIRGVHSPAPLALDGVLDEPVWRQAPVYELGNWVTEQSKVEPARARVAWTDTHLYIAIECDDSDLIAEMPKDQEHHYKFGDVVEVFVKPADETWYWEYYATPTSNKTAFFFPGRGRQGLPSVESYKSELRVAVTVDGTLNHWQDRDGGWCSEIAIPWSEFDVNGGSRPTATRWKIQFARYNYGRYTSTVELSMFPRLRGGTFHAFEQYANLVLE